MLMTNSRSSSVISAPKLANKVADEWRKQCRILSENLRNVAAFEQMYDVHLLELY